MADNPFDAQSQNTIKRLFAGSPITAGAAERVLKQLGATLQKKRGKGSHRRWKLPNRTKATIPGKASSDLRYDVCRSLRDQLMANNVTKDGGIKDE